MSPIKKLGLIIFGLGLLLFVGTLTLNDYKLSEKDLKDVVTNKAHLQLLRKEGNINKIIGNHYSSNFAFIDAIDGTITLANNSTDDWNKKINDYQAGQYKMYLTKHASTGMLNQMPLLFFILTIALACLGVIIFVLPDLKLIPGIKNNNIFQSKFTNGSWIGIIIGGFLILFYILLYWYPMYITNWIILVDPVSYWLNGSEASQWFLYGLLYTLAIAVMGVRMFIKYRHSNYHLIRTASVVFFQVAFAFLIPEILVRLNQPSMTLNTIWPLDYDFFYGYNLNTFTSSGAVGMFLLAWGLLLAFVAVPVLTYFYGKRWYCSWVCGCGGLAETLGDPYRQLSDKSLKAWKVERWIVHSVLIIVVVMTALTLGNYFSGQGIFGGLTYELQKTYGFLIGAAFAGVIGTGFYPFMGNRVWCRFGCPLAAILGLIQRFKSRFRITTNGGQCISCGNCSTYCEMGIDVRWYAQRGQNIIRSSCVGCGVCASVCPRGVLKLENGQEKGRFGGDGEAIMIGNDSIEVTK